MNYIFASRTNRAFLQTVFMAVVAAAAMFLLSFKAYQLSSLYLAVLMHKIKDACGCENMAQFFSMHPDIFIAVILFGAGIGIFVFYSLYKLAGLILRTRKYNAYYLSFAGSRRSAKLKAAAKALGLDETRIIEINTSDPAVFCFGFWSPKICIARGLADALSMRELKAVLSHEAQHMVSRDPLKMFIVKYFRSIFFFLPGIKNFAKKYITFSELAADEKASGNPDERSGLAGAILKISGQEEALPEKAGLSLSFFGSVMEERANRLSDKSYIPKFNFLDKSVIAGSLGLAIISLAAIFVFSDSTKAFEMHNISGCVSPIGNDRDSDLVCALSGEQGVHYMDTKDIFKVNNSLNSDNFQQNSVCRNH